MIIGIGTDLVAVSRMEHLYARYGSRLAQHVLTQEETGIMERLPNPATFIATRFAAKEALAKALGTGLRAPVRLTNIGVVNNDLRRPDFRFSPTLQGWLDAHGVGQVHLSLSDERAYVLAFVVVESRTSDLQTS